MRYDPSPPNSNDGRRSIDTPNDGAPVVHAVNDTSRIADKMNADGDENDDDEASELG